MFTKITHFREGIGDDSNRIFTKYEDFEEAKTAGLHDSCMSVVNHVLIMDDKGKIVASWNGIDNNFFVYKDAKGKFISPKQYFEGTRKFVQKYAFDNDMNIRVTSKGSKLRVYAGKYVIPIDSNMLLFIPEAIDAAQLKSWRNEDEGKGALPDEVIMDIFAEKLIERIRFGLSRNKTNWTWLRRSPLFRDVA